MWITSRDWDGDGDWGSSKAEEKELRSLWFCRIRAANNGAIRCISVLDNDDDEDDMALRSFTLCSGHRIYTYTHIIYHLCMQILNEMREIQEKQGSNGSTRRRCFYVVPRKVCSKIRSSNATRGGFLFVRPCLAASSVRTYGLVWLLKYFR